MVASEVDAEPAPSDWLNWKAEDAELAAAVLLGLRGLNAPLPPAPPDIGRDDEVLESPLLPLSMAPVADKGAAVGEGSSPALINIRARAAEEEEADGAAAGCTRDATPPAAAPIGAGINGTSMLNGTGSPAATGACDPSASWGPRDWKGRSNAASR